MTIENTDVLSRRKVPRRTIVKSAAWSLPAVAAAVATPLATASIPTADQNVIISSSCVGFNILGIGQSFPQFTITAVGAPIKAGSTFTLSGQGFANLTFADTTGLGFFNFFGNGTGATFTLSRDIPAGESASLQVNGLASIQVLRTYSMTVGSIIGNANSKRTDDSASQTLVGASVFGILVGYCG